jgi:hypothetical protein
MLLVASRAAEYWVREGAAGSKLLSCSTVQIGTYVPEDYILCGFQESLGDNPVELRRELYVFVQIMRRFSSSDDPGLRLIYALGQFLHDIRSLEEKRVAGADRERYRTLYHELIKDTGAPEVPSDQELCGALFPILFASIQRATGAANFQEFLKSDEWQAFVQQVMDNSIREGRCRDGVYNALVMALPEIVQPEMPARTASLASVFLWTEQALQDYRECWLKLFDSQLTNGKEERTYGPLGLAWKVNPIFALPKVDRTGSAYQSERNAVGDCLLPFRSGKFEMKVCPDEKGGTSFVSLENKRNTSKMIPGAMPNGEHEFTYITPFSPVEVLYRAARPLFHKRVAGFDAETDTLGALESAALDDILRLLLAHSDIRNEYLSFIAAFPDGKVTDEQEGHWGFNPTDPRVGAVVPSFRSIAYMAVNSIGEDSRIAERVAALNAHLYFWKVGMQGLNVYFFPSVEACKALALDLGYVREGRDLAGYQYVPPVPNFDPRHDRPAPPAGGFYKHFNLYGERIDVDPAIGDRTNPRSPAHPRNKGSPVQPKEPENFVRPYTRAELAPHADERQWLLCEVYYSSS